MLVALSASSANFDQDTESAFFPSIEGGVTFDTGAVRLERRRLSPILFPGFLAALLDFFVAVQLKLLLG